MKDTTPERTSHIDGIPVKEIAESFGTPSIVYSYNKIYENLNVIDGGTKPTKQEVEDGLAAMQAAWTFENDSYRSKRREEYPYLAEQLDYIYNHGIDKWKTDVIDPIKKKYPKPE